MIEVDIVTPNRKLVAGIKVSSVRLPSQSGELQILPGHTELLTLLGTGILSLDGDGAKPRLFAISYGFGEVRGDKITICAETAEESTEIDMERAKAAQKKAEKGLAEILSEKDFQKYQFKLQRSIVRQNIART